MRIREIQIKNYRAFHGSTISVNLSKSKEIKTANLIVYGENGSGKTSLVSGMRRRNFFIPILVVSARSRSLTRMPGESKATYVDTSPKTSTGRYEKVSREESVERETNLVLFKSKKQNLWLK